MEKLKWISGGLRLLATVFLTSTSLLAQAQTAQLFGNINVELAPIAVEPISIDATDMQIVRTLSDAQLAAFIGCLNVTPLLAVEELPRQGMSGTFYSLQHPEWPPLPCNARGASVWPMNNFYLMNDLDLDYNVPVISLQSGMRSMAMASEMSSGEGDGVIYLSGTGYTVDTNGLWLEITNVANGWANLNLHHATNLVYEIVSKTNLADAAWNIETALWPTAEQTEVLPFTVPTLNREALFLRAMDWTEVDSNTNGLPDWWEWKYFGHIGVDPNGDPDGDGVSTLDEYETGSNPVMATTMVLAWGDNTFGECNVPADLTNAVAVAGNGDGYPVINTAFSTALKYDGTIVAWGDNSHGQTNTPAGLSDATDISAGTCHGLALRSNGVVASWGHWKYYQPTTNGDYVFPEAIVPSGISDIVAIAAGRNHDLAVRSDGTVFSWGYVTNAAWVRVPSNLPPAKAVGAGWYYSAALLTNGTVAVWAGAWNDPTNPIPWNIPANLTNVVAISGGPFDLLALKADGTVVDLAANTYLDFPSASNSVTIANGFLPGLALRGDGAALILSNSISTPSYPLEQIKAIGAGWLHALVVRDGLLTPIIITQPASQAVLPGSNVTFTVQSVGLAGATYQWQSNTVNIFGATNTVLTMTGVTTNTAASYRVVVSNRAGVTTSSNAVLTVYDVTPPAIVSVSLPTNPVVNYSSNLTLSVVATAHGTASGFLLAYQWWTNGVKISGATTSNYTATVFGSRTYSVTVSNVLGGANASWPVTVYYPGGIVIPSQPTNQYQIAGGNVTFWGSGIGSNALTYQWTFNGTNLVGATNAALTLANVSAANEGAYNYVLTDGVNSLASSNANFYLVTVPAITSQSTPTNRVCIYGNTVNFSVQATAPGMTNGFPLSYRWQWNGTNIGGATTNSYSFTVNDTNGGVYSVTVTNRAGSTNLSWQVTVTNAINVTNDLLLIYNTNSVDSKTVLDYYLAHRPGVSGANVLGIGCTNAETISPDYYTNVFAPQIQAWLTNNPAKRPQYVILFYDVPSRVNTNSASGIWPELNWPNIQNNFNSGSVVSGWNPFVTSINMNTTNDCIAYINKLEFFGTNYSPGQLVISASAGGYGNTNFVVDDVNFAYCGDTWVPASTNSLSAAGVSAGAIQFLTGCEIGTNLLHLTNTVNVAGYISWGVYTSLGPDYPINGKVQWGGNSGWWIIRTEESFNGQRQAFGQGNFVKWFTSTSFGGTNYSNTPVGGVTYTDEPFANATDNGIYFGLWAAGKNLAICGWRSRSSGSPPHFQIVGDPFVSK